MTSEKHFNRRALLKAGAASALASSLSAIGLSVQAATEKNDDLGVPTEPWLIDVHYHIVPDVYREGLINAGIDLSGGIEIPPWSEQIALDAMDELMIEKAYTSVSSPGVHFGDDRKARSLSRSVNEVAATLKQRNPDRFGGWASIPLPDVDGSLRELDYALDTLKLDGVVLMSSQSDGRYLGDAQFDAFMAELNRRKATVFVHPTTPVSSKDIIIDVPGFVGEFVFDTTRAILNLVWSGTAHRYPDIKFIFSHAGGTLPYIAWRASTMDTFEEPREANFPLGMMAYFKRFYYDLALSTAPYALNSLRTLVPREQVFFGSDFPFAPMPLIKQVSNMGLNSEGITAEDRLVVGRKNALRLL